MKYLRSFQNEAAYIAAKGGEFYKPCVSLIKDSMSLMFDPISTAYTFNPRYLFSDLTTGTELVSGKTVIGVEVIPAAHMADHKSRYVSVRNMSRAAGEVEVGSVAVGNNSENPASNIPWGNWNDDIEGMTNYQSVGYKLNTSEEAKTEDNPQGLLNELSTSTDQYLATDYDTGFVGNDYPFVDNVFLPGYSSSGVDTTKISLPYPFNADGTKNTLYWNNGSGMAVTDMDGASNTDILLGRKTVTWSTGDALDTQVGNAQSTEKINHPAAIACRRFNPADSNTAGQWYLPSAGELGYLFANIAKINAKINALPEGQGVKLGVLNSKNESVDSLGYWLWSSSERTKSYAWYLGLSNGSLFYYSNKGSNDLNIRVRAFFQL